jgi:hypothetical protein
MHWRPHLGHGNRSFVAQFDASTSRDGSIRRVSEAVCTAKVDHTAVSAYVVAVLG